MPFDTSDLDQPIDWHAPKLATFLSNLQGNILKGHGRETTINTLLSFNGADRDAVTEMIRAIGGSVTSAAKQLADAEMFKLFKRPGGTVAFFFLTSAGYEWLGLSPPDDPAFRAGMAASRDKLADPPKEDWWEHWQQPDIHAMLLVGDETAGEVTHALQYLLTLIDAAGVGHSGPDAGQALRRPIDGAKPGEKGPGIEHFGYIDGRSQPLMLSDEVADEFRGDTRPRHFDPAVGPGKLALVPDPHGGGDDAFGSYLVYRRLEQNVQAFKMREGGFEFAGQPQNLADALGLEGDEDRERAGALVVGRFEDGTSVAILKDPPQPVPAIPDNNFNYAHDPHGDRCPLQAHIRKTNPRRDEPERLMPRRGIPFGERGKDSFEDPKKMPTGGVGLLFMAYNQDIGRQFEFVQSKWANNAGFPDADTGLDPVIGQGAGSDQQWPPVWGGSARRPFAFNGFVTMTGGEYFFAPSLPFLRSIR